MKQFPLILASVVITIFLLLGCTVQKNRTDTEMLNAATEIYKDYLFEYGIDGKLFSATTEARQNDARIYKWIAIGTESNPVGVTVAVTKAKDAKPEMTLIGSTDAWLPFVGSKDKKQK